MIFTTKINDVFLCSINQRYVKSGILSKAYRDSRKFLVDWFSLYYKGEPMDGFIGVEYIIEAYVDIDNYEKVIFDSLQHAGVIQDDRQICIVNKVKVTTKKGKPKHLSIKVFQIGQEEIQEQRNKLC